MEWIPVDERLPEIETMGGKLTHATLTNFVLVYTKEGDTHVAYAHIIGDRLHKWSDGEQLHNIQATHWMPLPEPPQQWQSDTGCRTQLSAELEAERKVL